jgi:hypothetical protein
MSYFSTIASADLVFQGPQPVEVDRNLLPARVAQLAKIRHQNTDHRAVGEDGNPLSTIQLKKMVQLQLDALEVDGMCQQ